MNLRAEFDDSLYSSLHFTYAKELSGQQYSFYSWNRMTDIFIVVSSTDIMIVKYEEAKGELFKKNVFLTIPLNHDGGVTEDLENDIVDLAEKELNGGELNGHDLINDFIIDLGAYQFFNDKGRSKEIQVSIEKIPLMRGYLSKELFYYFNKLWKLALRESKTDNKEEWKNIYKKNAIIYGERFISFIENKGNEKYFSDPKNSRSEKFLRLILGKQGKSGTENHFFRSINEEFRSAYYLFKDEYYGQQSEKKIELQTIQIKLAGFLLTRYYYLRTIEVFLGKTAKKIFLLAQGIILTAIIAYCIWPNVLNRFWKFAESILWNESPGEDFIKIGKGVIVLGIITLPAIVVCYYAIKNKVGFLINRLALPRLIIAIVSGWIVFLTAEELTKIDEGLDWLFIIFIGFGVSVVLAYFMYYELRNISLNIKNTVSKISYIIFCSFLISFVIGFFITQILDDKYVSKPKLEKENFELKEKLNYMEKYLTDSVTSYLVHQGDSTSNFEDIHIKVSFIHLMRIFKSDLKKIPALDPSILIKNTTEERIDLMISNSKYEKAFTNDKVRKSLSSMVNVFKNYLSENVDSIKTDSLIKSFSSFKQLTLESLEKDQIENTRPLRIILRSFLAMFVGIFLKLIIEDKSVTQPI